MIVAGIGIGLVTAPLMNITQSAVAAAEQSEISGLSRAVSSLGGAFGTAVAGAVLMAALIGSLSAQVERFSGIPANEKAKVVKRTAQGRPDGEQRPGQGISRGKGRAGAAGGPIRTVQPERPQRRPAEGLAAVGIIGLVGLS